MEKNLLNSSLDRENILNNKYAIKEIAKVYKLEGIIYKNVYYYTNQQIADFFEVDVRTIERTIENNREELESNDFTIINGDELKKFKQSIPENKKKEFGVANNASALTISSFRTVLNFSMLLKNSDKAMTVRSAILDITIDLLTQKAGGNVKYINQRDSEYLDSTFREESERKKFTTAIKDYIEMGQYKYAYFTDKVYKAIFKENTRQYKNILSLTKKDNARATMYSEVLLVISSFEAGIAYEFRIESQNLGRKLNKEEADKLILNYSNHPSMKPLLDNARNKMASRDLSLRDAYHDQLKNYISSVDPTEYDKFLGEQSKSLEKQIEEHRDVFERLRNK